MRHRLLLSALSIAAVSSASAQQAPVLWATDSTAPCVGITVSINADTAKMQTLVGPRWRVLSSKDGTASASLFITKCPRSTVGDKRIGSAAIAALILVAEPRGDVAAGGRSPIVPLAFGESGAPVTELFRAHAFSTRAASLTLDVDSAARPRRVRFGIATPTGRIEGSALVSDSATVRTVDSRLFGTDPNRRSDFSGPEWMRRSSASATVTTTGTTLFSELGVVTMPTTAIYDGGFGWRFTFQLRP